MNRNLAVVSIVALVALIGIISLIITNDNNNSYANTLFNTAKKSGSENNLYGRAISGLEINKDSLPPQPQFQNYPPPQPELKEIRNILPIAIPGEVIIKTKNTNIQFKGTKATASSSSLNAKLSQYALKSVSDITLTDTRIKKIVIEDPTRTESIIKDLRSDPAIEYAEPNYLYYSSTAPNDPLYPSQWAHSKTSAEAAWKVQTGNFNTVIAIIDTGVDYTHEDLINSMKADCSNGCPTGAGYDFVDLSKQDIGYFLSLGFTLAEGEDYTIEDNSPSDYGGHGTHCAGIIAATGNNNIGVIGVCPECKIMPIRAGYSLKFSNMEIGFLDEAAIIKSIRYAADNNADIISMSFGAYQESQGIKDALNYAYQKDVVLIAAAGNNNENLKSYPAGDEMVIAVTATDTADTRAVFSNYGEWTDIAAPGLNILSTVPKSGSISDASGYKSISGTSMATPYIAGAAGLLRSSMPNINNEEVRKILIESVDDLNGEQKYVGHGRINLFKMLNSGEGLIAEISNYKNFDEVKGVIPLIGKAYGTTFKSYKILQGKGMYPTSYEEIYNSKIMVNAGTLTKIDTNTFPEGYNKLILEVENQQGKITRHSVVLNVNNVKNQLIVSQDGTGQFKSIQDAIDTSGYGDDILIKCGTYKLDNPIRIEYKQYLAVSGIDKNCVTIIGKNINCVEIWTATTEVNSWSHVTDHITIRNTKFVCDYSSILVAGTLDDDAYSGSKDYVVIENNIFDQKGPSDLNPDNKPIVNRNTINLQSSSNNKIIHNIFFNAPIYADSILTFGLGLASSDNNNEIAYNLFEGNSKIFDFSSRDTSPEGGRIGITIVEGANNNIHNNYFINTSIIAADASFPDSYSNTYNNEFLGPANTPYTLSQASMMLYGNHRLYKNNIINYPYHLFFATPPSINPPNQNVGNYWGVNTEIDANNDGIVDVPRLLNPETYDNYPAVSERRWLGVGGSTISFKADEEKIIRFSSFTKDTPNFEDIFGGYLALIEYVEDTTSNQKFDPSIAKYTLKTLSINVPYKIKANKDFKMLLKGTIEDAQQKLPDFIVKDIYFQKNPTGSSNILTEICNNGDADYIPTIKDYPLFVIFSNNNINSMAFISNTRINANTCIKGRVTKNIDLLKIYRTGKYDISVEINPNTSPKKTQEKNYNNNKLTRRIPITIEEPVQDS